MSTLDDDNVDNDDSRSDYVKRKICIYIYYYFGDAPPSGGSDSTSHIAANGAPVHTHTSTYWKSIQFLYSQQDERAKEKKKKLQKLYNFQTFRFLLCHLSWLNGTTLVPHGEAHFFSFFFFISLIAHIVYTIQQCNVLAQNVSSIYPIHRGVYSFTLLFCSARRGAHMFFFRFHFHSCRVSIRIVSLYRSISHLSGCGRGWESVGWRQKHTQLFCFFAFLFANINSHSYFRRQTKVIHVNWYIISFLHQLVLRIF